MAHVEAMAHISGMPIHYGVVSVEGVGEWHPVLAKVEANGEKPGAIRKAKGRDGQDQVEILREVNPSRISIGTL